MLSLCTKLLCVSGRLPRTYFVAKELPRVAGAQISFIGRMAIFGSLKSGFSDTTVILFRDYVKHLFSWGLDNNH